jgi:hypothetical protein
MLFRFNSHFFWHITLHEDCIFQTAFTLSHSKIDEIETRVPMLPAPAPQPAAQLRGD